MNLEATPAMTDLLRQYPGVEISEIEYAISAEDFAKYKQRFEVDGIEGGTLGVIWMSDGTIPLVCRTKTLSGWAIPGGGNERNHTFTDTLTREIREEVGVELVPDSIRLILLERRVFKAPDGNQLQFPLATFDADARAGEAARQTQEALEEGLTVATFALDALPDNMIFADRDKILKSAKLRGISLRAQGAEENLPGQGRFSNQA